MFYRVILAITTTRFKSERALAVHALSIFIELSTPLEIIRMATWNDTEVLQLISLWGEEGVQEQLEGSKRNKHVYTKIALALAKKNINKDCSQCRTKIKKLKLDYRKAKDKNGKTGRGRTTWKYFEALDPIWVTSQHPNHL